MHGSLYDILLDVSKSSMIDNGDLHAAGLLILTAAIHGLHINRAGIWLFTEDNQVICGKMLIDGDHCELDTSLCLARENFPRYFGSLDSERAVVALRCTKRCKYQRISRELFTSFWYHFHARCPHPPPR